MAFISQLGWGILITYSASYKQQGSEMPVADHFRTEDGKEESKDNT